MRVFLDANILFSASFSNSLLALLLGNLKERAELISSAYTTAEAEKNLQAKMPKCLPAFKDLEKSLKMILFQIFDLEVPLTSEDKPILCGAIAAKADFLLTGDKKDFGHLFGKTVRGVKIVNVSLLVEELQRLGFLEI